MGLGGWAGVRKRKMVKVRVTVRARMKVRLTLLIPTPADIAPISPTAVCNACHCIALLVILARGMAWACPCPRSLALLRSVSSGRAPWTKGEVEVEVEDGDVSDGESDGGGDGDNDGGVERA